MEDFHAWLIAWLARLSRNHDIAKAIDYMLRRWPAFDGVCIANNAAEQALRSGADRCAECGRWR
ncbi:transposase IS66 [Mesorhizobium alhagi CCNWXJ12-2]|uniref:Transposase IS66 n=1 Tax=Mesorhizobium alhagi CCNWXJ12-2 TaxID=1107882 RepID=H0HXA4_9HYPH|nr:transposase IS66 [Mesorhizobium alhagi CCNWXJ12-2]